MNSQSVLSVAFLILVIACLAHAHKVPRLRHRYVEVEDEDEISPVYKSVYHANKERALSSKQARVFPGAVAIKKLVLLKFKKIIPISLILLKSSDENEGELVPVYPTSDIPSDVQFIPTPNGISGHRDVQAIAIPSELHQQLQLSGLANVESIESLLNQAQDGGDAAESEDKPLAVLNEEPNADDELLDVKEDDVDQLLDNSAVDKNKIATANVQTVRRLAADDVMRPSIVHAAQLQAGVEEIPVFLYSTKDTPQKARAVRKSGHKRVKHTGRGYYAY